MFELYLLAGLYKTQLNKRADIRLKDEADYICYLLYHNTYSLVIIHWGQFVHSLCFSPFVNLYTSVIYLCYATHLYSTDNFNLLFLQCASCCHFYQWNTVYVSEVETKVLSVSKEALLIFFKSLPSVLCRLFVCSPLNEVFLSASVDIKHDTF